MEVQRKWKEMFKRAFVRACDVLEGGALRKIVISRSMLVDVVERSRVLCEDYIYCRLQGMYSRDAANYETEEAEETKFNTQLSDVSRQLQEVGMRLELSYPSLFVDLPRQLSMPLRSQVAVRKALVCIGDSIFRGQPPMITWFRIVALLAVSAAVAREVVTNGNAHLIPVVVTTFAELVDRYLAVWIYRQGGWVKALKEFQVADKRLVRARLVVASGATLLGFAFVWLYLAFFFELIHHPHS